MNPTVDKARRRELKKQKRIRDFLKARRSPDQLKPVIVEHVAGKNIGVPPNSAFPVIAGWCPCANCGHESMLDCYEQDCKCCSSVCT